MQIMTPKVDEQLNEVRSSTGATRGLHWHSLPRRENEHHNSSILPPHSGNMDIVIFLFTFYLFPPELEMEKKSKVATAWTLLHNYIFPIYKQQNRNDSISAYMWQQWNILWKSYEIFFFLVCLFFDSVHTEKTWGFCSLVILPAVLRCSSNSSSFPLALLRLRRGY